MHCSFEDGIGRTMGGAIAHDDELGIRFALLEGRILRATMPGVPANCGLDGCVADGAVAALLDTACGIGAMSALQFAEVVATIDLRIDYLRAIPGGVAAEARSDAVLVSGRPNGGGVVMRGAVGWDDEPAALCVGRFVRRPLPAKRSSPDPDVWIRDSTASDYPSMMGFADEDGGTRMPFRPGVVGNGSLPSLHGGAVAALLQEGARRELVQRSDRPFRLSTIHVSFLRFGRAEDLIVEARPLRIGRSTATLSAEAFQGGRQDRIVATANVTFSCDGESP